MATATPDQGETPTISVVVPAHGGGPAFERCLDALAGLDPPPLEIIVAADGNLPEDREAATRHGFLIASTPTRGGPAAARNAGAAMARGDVLYFVDADVVVPADVIAQVQDELGGHPEIAGLIGSYDTSPEALNFLSQYKNLVHHFVHQCAKEEAFTFWGACGAIRREAFHAVGGFDESYDRPAIEDIDLGYRLRASGHRLHMCHDLQVKHLKRWTARGLLKTELFDRAVPWTRLILRSGGFNDDLNIGRSGRAAVTAVYVLLILVVSAIWWPWGLVGAGLVGVFLIVLDRPLLGFFGRTRGWQFASRALLFHWFYYLYCGIGFGMGLALHLVSPLPAAHPAPAAAPVVLPRSSRMS